MILLDTDILSYLVRHPEAVPLAVRVARVPLPQRFTSSITVGELLYGVARERGRPGLRAELQAEVFDRVIVLPFDFAAAEEYAQLRVLLERRGTPLPEADLRIAAIALAHNLTLITGNERHFGRVPGLRVENWLRDDASQGASP